MESTILKCVLDVFLYLKNLALVSSIWVVVYTPSHCCHSCSLFPAVNSFVITGPREFATISFENSTTTANSAPREFLLLTVCLLLLRMARRVWGTGQVLARPGSLRESLFGPAWFSGRRAGQASIDWRPDAGHRPSH
jgi:hypothetical protein